MRLTIALAVLGLAYLVAGGVLAAFDGQSFWKGVRAAGFVGAVLLGLVLALFLVIVGLR